MKKLFLLLIIISTTIFSQTEIPELKNKFALQFQIGSIISLRDFQGFTVSGKYHFSNCVALRFGAGASISDADGDGFEAPESENFKEFHYTYESSDRVIAVRTQIIYYFSFLNEFALFAGGGPFYSISERDYERNFADTSMVDNIENSEGDEYGADIIFGAEWFVNENISISGEYGMSVSAGKEKYKREYSYSKSNSDYNIFRIRPIQVRLGLSVYF